MNSWPILLLLGLMVSCQAVQLGDDMSRKPGIAVLEGNGVPPDFHTGIIPVKINIYNHDESKAYLLDAIKQLRNYRNDGGRKYLVLCVVNQKEFPTDGSAFKDGIILLAEDMKNLSLTPEEVYRRKVFQEPAPFKYDKEKKSSEWMIVTKFLEREKRNKSP